MDNIPKKNNTEYLLISISANLKPLKLAKSNVSIYDVDVV